MTPAASLAASLQNSWGSSPGVEFVEAYGGPVAVLRAAGSEAEVAIQGAQALSWRPAGHANALWLSPAAQLGTGKAVRGGVPICWPWFGPNADQPAAPAHGFVRAAPWRVVETSAADDLAAITMAYMAAPSKLWPHAAEARLTVSLGATLTLKLETRNTGAGAVALTEALHTYIAVSDIGDVTVRGLEGVAYIDQLAGGALSRDAAPLAIATEIDRIYQDHAGEVVIDDRRLGRRVRVAKSGSLSTVIWNPWIEKSARLGDMGADGYRRMLCVETANAGKHAVSLAPSESHVLRTELSIEPR